MFFLNPAQEHISTLKSSMNVSPTVSTSRLFKYIYIYIYIYSIYLPLYECALKCISPGSSFYPWWYSVYKTCKIITCTDNSFFQSQSKIDHLLVVVSVYWSINTALSARSNFWWVILSEKCRLQAVKVNCNWKAQGRGWIQEDFQVIGYPLEYS